MSAVAGDPGRSDPLLKDSIEFRPLEFRDFPVLARWLAEPHVSRWWNHEYTIDAVERDFGPTARGEKRGEDLLALARSTPFGLVQRSRLGDFPDYLVEISRHTSIPPRTMTLDYLIGEPELVGHGLGTALVKAAIRSTWSEYQSAIAIVVPVVASNEASWRALERAGMTRVAEGAITPDNPVDDSLHYIYRIDR